MDPRELFGCLLLILGGVYFLQFEGIAFRKAGLVCIWLASGLGTLWLTNSLPAAAAVMLLWICFPLWEMFFVLRKLRVPRHRALTDARLPRDADGDLAEVHRELRQLGFDQVDECRLEPVQHEQYYRIFLRRDGLVQATIGYVAQGSLGFHFLAFTANGQDGRRWVAWDYPLTYGLVMPPETAVYRVLNCETAADLQQAHLDFLEINEVKIEDLAPAESTREAVRLRLEETLDQQIDYNVSLGYLAPALDSETASLCYSWRGTLYVAGQVLRDLFF